jgi:hypothetical protein
MKRIMGLSFVFGIALVLIVACTQATPTPTQAPPTVDVPAEDTPTTVPPVPTETATEVEETEAAVTETATTAPTEEGTEVVDDAEALIVERCSECHSVDRVFNADKSADQWSSTIDRMVDYGTVLNEAEKQQMIDWLISRGE